jgi:hypothetical protein
MKKVAVTVLSLAMLLTQESAYASQEVILGSGAIFEKKHGAVITTGVVITIQAEIDNYISRITEAEIPLNVAQLYQFILNEKDLKILHKNRHSDYLTTAYQNSVKAYFKAVEAHEKYWENNARKNVTSSEEYIKSMKDIEATTTHYNLLISLAGKEMEQLETIDKQYNSQLTQLKTLDNSAVEKINLILTEHFPAERLLKNSDRTYSAALKYNFKKPDKKTGECKQSKSLLFIKKTSVGNNCVFWKFKTKLAKDNNEISKIIIDSFDSYYAVYEKIFGSYVNGKPARNDGLKHELRIANKNLSTAKKKYKSSPDRTIHTKPRGIIDDYSRIPQKQANWESHIERLAKKPFNPDNSQDYEIHVKQPYIQALKHYYLSIASEMLDSELIEVTRIDSYKFKIDDGKYLATFAGFKSPISTYNYGVLTKLTTAPTIMVQEFGHNKLLMDYDPNTSNRDYLFAVILHLINQKINM